jgi:hypothetical protein
MAAMAGCQSLLRQVQPWISKAAGPFEPPRVTASSVPEGRDRVWVFMKFLDAWTACLFFEQSLIIVIEIISNYKDVCRLCPADKKGQSGEECHER